MANLLFLTFLCFFNVPVQETGDRFEVSFSYLWSIWILCKLLASWSPYIEKLAFLSCFNQHNWSFLSLDVHRWVLNSQYNQLFSLNLSNSYYLCWALLSLHFSRNFSSFSKILLINTFALGMARNSICVSHLYQLPESFFIVLHNCFPFCLFF